MCLARAVLSPLAMAIASSVGRVSPVNGHDELLSRLCLPHSHTRPLSALPGRKRDHPDDDKTDVGVDAVLSADVDDAPMRQRQYTAPVHALLNPTIGFG